MRRVGAAAAVLAWLIMVGQALPAVAAPTTGAACGRRSFAAAIGTNGKVLWRTAMTADPEEFQESFTPAVGGSLSYWPEDGVVHALRNKDGHEVWRQKQGDSIDGLWLTHGVVSLLSAPFLSKGVLSGLDARTGRVKWQLRIPAKGLTLDPPALTGDGGLVWLRADRRLQVVDLVTGRIRWSKIVGTTASLKSTRPMFTAGGGRVFVGLNGEISSYGPSGALAWTIAALTDRGELKLIRGELVIVTHTDAKPSAVRAVAASTGVTSWEWDFDVDGEFILASDGYSIIVGRMLGPNEFRFDVASGQEVWVKRLGLLGEGQVAIAGHHIAEIDGGASQADGAQLVLRDLDTGAVLWEHPLTNDAATGSLAFVGKSLMLIPDGERAGPNEPLYGFDPASGKPTWTITSLRPVQGLSASTSRTSYVSVADQTETCPY